MKSPEIGTHSVVMARVAAKVDGHTGHRTRPFESLILTEIAGTVRFWLDRGPTASFGFVMLSWGVDQAASRVSR